jgi:RimJ/RimL family protein N-acetyltransferase
MMGGSDARNLTARVLDALALPGFEDLEATVVVGGSSPHFERLQKRSPQTGRRVTLLSDASNMTELMAAADLAISGAGSTCWELCRMGLPALLIDVEPNQTRVAKDLDRRGCAVYLGDRSVTAEQIAERLRSLLISSEMRYALSCQGRELVDGNGARRVFAELCGKRAIWRRHARLEDSRLLWEWANDAAVRAASFSTAPIPWETHVAWLVDQIERKESLLLIAEDENEIALGQIRFDLESESDANLNISLAKEKRGCGLALPVINAGIGELFSSTDIARVHAFVKTDNTASARAFEKAGFLREGMERVHDCDAIHFVLSRTKPV